MLETCDIRFPLALLPQNDTVHNNLLHHAGLFTFCFVICSCNDNCWSGFVEELALSRIIYEFKSSKIIKISTLISIFKVFTKTMIIPHEIDIARPVF